MRDLSKIPAYAGMIENHMLDIKFIRENVELVKQNTSNRRVEVDIDKLLALDEERRGLIAKIDETRGELKKGSKKKPSEEEINQLRQLGDNILKLEQELKMVEDRYLNILMQVPNL